MTDERPAPPVSTGLPRRSPGGFPVVGVIGGGQLARMMQGPAVELGVQLTVLAEAPDVAAALVVPSSPVGAADDMEAVRAFARTCDVVTFDHEHVPPPVLAALVADGVTLHPRPEALRFAQDKLAMRSRLGGPGGLGVPCPRWTCATTADEVETFGAEVGWPVVAKTPRGGYDGKGVRVVSGPDELTDWLAGVGGGALHDGVLLEEKVDFTRELAVLVARSPSGQAAAWPVVETVQVEGICTEVLAPAPGLDPDLAARATAAALTIAGALDVTGVMAVELFEVPGPSGEPSYVVNELAMRPHNSGHWSMDGAVTGQFEQHLRAVLDLPLGDPGSRGSWTVMANVLGGADEELYSAYRHVMARDPAVKVHLYGKGVRPGRKIGHVNVCVRRDPSGGALADARERAVHAADYLRGVVRE